MINKIIYEPYFKSTLEFYFKINISLVFLNIANKQLTFYFEKNTGIKVHIKTKLSISLLYFLELNYDSVSSFQCEIVIGIDSTPIKICWSSKSGKIYKIDDEGIIENDIDFWFEGLQPELYYKQLYPSFTLPFKFKNLPFELDIKRLVIDTELIIEFDKDITQSILNQFNTIDELIQKGVTKGYGGGYIHNFKKETNRNSIIYWIDVGSVGIIFIKKIVNKLQLIDGIKNVIIQ